MIMNNIIKENYESIVNRGLITWSTPLEAFLNKIEEEYHELTNAVDKDHFSEELADVILTCLNTAYHFKIDIELELKKKIQINKNRCNDTKRRT